jgi:hypothetical protein
MAMAMKNLIKKHSEIIGIAAETIWLFVMFYVLIIVGFSL